MNNPQVKVSTFYLWMLAFAAIGFLAYELTREASLDIVEFREPAAIKRKVTFQNEAGLKRKILEAQKKADRAMAEEEVARKQLEKLRSKAKNSDPNAGTKQKPPHEARYFVGGPTVIIGSVRAPSIKKIKIRIEPSQPTSREPASRLEEALEASTTAALHTAPKKVFVNFDEADIIPE